MSRPVAGEPNSTVCVSTLPPRPRPPLQRDSQPPRRPALDKPRETKWLEELGVIKTPRGTEKGP